MTWRFYILDWERVFMDRSSLNFNRKFGATIKRHRLPMSICLLIDIMFIKFCKASSISSPITLCTIISEERLKDKQIRLVPYLQINKRFSKGFYTVFMKYVFYLYF